ncbi:hypothetical protein [Armatimonas sp.]|uniref:hypothetical protein n=1 Tax=Armatimonas sp. TaxID=1872638 RepID=UPI00286C025D|nr:hypothetical protein [Armatimonas sp.]
MSNLHKAFVFDEAAFRRDLAPILDRHDDAALEHFISDHRAQLRNPRNGGHIESDWRDDAAFDGFARRTTLALTAYYDPTANIGLGSAASKCRFGLIDLYPESRVFVSGGALGVPDGYFQSASYVAESVAILENLRSELPLKADVIDPVLTMLQAAKSVGQGLYIIF